MIAVSAKQVGDWLQSSQPAERLVYAVGMGIVRQKDPVIATLRRAYNNGTIEFAQRRIGAGEFEYLAIKRRRTVVRGPFDTFQV